MSLRGVRQLKELVIRYSDYDGSSKGIREWMNKNLLNFAKANPALQIKTELKRNKHPILRGLYVNGNSKTICVKNESINNIQDQVLHLRNQIGRKVHPPFHSLYNFCYLTMSFLILF
jgi:large subunit ribosomal protein L43